MLPLLPSPFSKRLWYYVTYFLVTQCVGLIFINFIGRIRLSHTTNSEEISKPDKWANDPRNEKSVKKIIEGVTAPPLSYTSAYINLRDDNVLSLMACHTCTFAIFP